MKILELLKTNVEARRRENFKTLRGLLEKSLDGSGNLNAGDQESLGDIVAKLKLTVEDVAGFVRNIEGVRKATADEKLLADLRPQLQKAKEAFEAWAARRAEAIEKLDAEGRPLMGDFQTLEQRGNQLLMRENLSAELRDAARELWEIAPPPPPPPPLTDAQRMEEQREATRKMKYNSIIVGFLDGMQARGGLDGEHQDILEEGLEKHWPVRGFTSEKPLTRQDLPESCREDPRTAILKSLVNRIQNGNQQREFLDKETNAALDRAIAEGKLDISKWPLEQRTNPHIEDIFAKA